MHKNGIKNFIYSFMLSLFAVVAANKAIFRTPKKDISETQTSNAIKQNISLFSKSSDAAGIMQAAPDSTIDVSEIEKISMPAIEVSAAAEELPPVTMTPEQVAPDINTDIAAAEEIVLEKENIITKSDQPPAYEKSGIVYADISDTIADEKEQTALEAKVIYFPEDDGASVTLAAAEPIAEPAVAQTTQEAQNIIEDDDIPLQENSEILYAQVNVLQSADHAQIAMLEPNTLISSIEDLEKTEEKTLAEANLKQNEWVQMSAKTEDSPWVIAKGNKFAKNKAVIEQFNDVALPEETKLPEPETASLQAEPLSDETAETKIAYQMIQNLLIPIPDDIMNDSNLTPQLSVTPKEKSEAKNDENKAEAQAQKKTEQTLNDKEKQSGLFKSIASWFSDDKKANKDQTKSKTTDKNTSSAKKGFDFFGLNLNEENAAAPQILPAELRLSFQPNRAEISGQTLRWIHAFADNARDNDNLYIEIRIDGTSSFALQKKRLNLLSTILANRGVDFRKINIVFTSREPNSFIIRNIRFNNEDERAENKNNANSYYRPW